MWLHIEQPAVTRADLALFKITEVTLSAGLKPQMFYTPSDAPGVK